MAGYYDKNKDYSLAIKNAQNSGASQAEIDRLREERQNKIDAQYGGRDPYKGSSNIMGSSGSSSRPGSSSGAAYIPSRPAGSSYSGKNAGDFLSDSRGDYSLAIVKAQQAGASNAIIAQLRQERQNKIDTQYGGKDPYYGRHNIMGTAVSSIWKPSPQVDYGPGMARPSIKNNVLRGGRGYENARVALGEFTYIFNEKGQQVGNIRDYGASANTTIMTQHADDSPAHRAAYDAAARGDWDTVGHYLGVIAQQGGRNQYGDYDMTEANRYNEELQLEFPKIRDFYRNKYDSIYGVGAWDDPNHHGANRGNADPHYADMVQDYRENGTVLPLGPLGSLNGGFGGGTGGGSSSGSRAEDYLRELAQAKKDAQEAALRASFQQGQANLQAQSNQLDSLYSTQRNQAAAQRELEQMRLSEMGLAHGLNTGAYGQLAAGQSAAYLDALAGLSAKEAADRAALDMQLQQMTNKFQTDLAMGNAQTDAWLYDQLYDAYLRQQEAAAEREKERFRQQQMMAQQQAELEARNEAAAKKAAADRAKLMASYGDFSGYAALGYTPEEIAFLERAYAIKHAR